MSEISGTPRRLGRPHHRVRRRVAARDAGAQYGPVEPGHTLASEVAQGQAVPFRLGATGQGVVPAGDVDARGRERQGRGVPGLAEADDGDARSLEQAEVDHPRHLSFRVERPISARMTAMIQKRMTMVGSCQPFFSK